MIVYRVEHKTSHVGPFGWEYSGGMKVGSNKHPLPSEDGIYAGSAYIYGCESLRHLSDWFTNSYMHLRENGFHIVEYESDDFHKGKTQVAFNKASAKVIKPRNLGEMLRFMEH